MQHPTAQAAAWYRGLGWATVRVPPLSKAPVDRDWPGTDYPPEAFADGDNIGVKLGTPSGGLVDVDLDCPEAIALAPLYLPATCTFGRIGPGKTPGTAVAWDHVGKARHWLYVCATKTRKPPRTHIEIRSTGGQTIMPGSIHETRVSIEWVSCVPPVVLEEPELLGRVGRLMLATVFARVWPGLSGAKHNAILSLAGALWHAGWELDDALAVLLPPMLLDGSSDAHREAAIRSTWVDEEKARTGWPTCEQIFGALDSKAMQRCAELVPTVPRWRQNDAAPGEVDESDLHDVGNAERFLRDYGDELRFAPGLGWLQWDGTRWAEHEPTALIIRSVRAMARAGEEKKSIALIKWAHTSMGAGKIAATKHLSSEIAERTGGDDLDVNPWLLNCPNGMVDLRTGQLVAHAREAMATRCTGVEFDPSATCPRFVRFLIEVFGGDLDLVAYVLRYLGYSLTGDVREQVFQVWHGHGANGKSTLIELLLHVLGDYSQRMADDLLTARRFGRDSSAPSPDVARMRGARFAAGTEAGEGLRWNEPLVKTLTGGDRIVARHLKREPIEFRPTWKLVLAVNHKPIVRGTDHGIWRRIHLVPFEISFAGARLDPTLSGQLEREAAGVLALLVRSCLEWQRVGLSPPRRVAASVEDYKAEHDVVGAFLGECTKRDPKGSIPKAALYRMYRTWAADNGEYTHGKHAFARLLHERQLIESIDASSWIEIGIASAGF